MNETKAIHIASVKYAGDFKLRLRWVNRSVTLVDLSEPIHRLKGLQPLLDTKVFAGAKKGEGGHSVMWSIEVDMGEVAPNERPQVALSSKMSLPTKKPFAIFDSRFCGW